MGEYIIIGVFFILFLVLCAMELCMYLYKFEILDDDQISTLLLIRAMMLLSLLIISYLILTYNLYRYYKFDYESNNRSMLLFFMVEITIQCMFSCYVLLPDYEGSG